MAQIYNIIEGWGLYLKGEVPKFTEYRKEICKKCPFAVMGTYEKWMPEKELKEIQGLKCEKCECPLSTILRSKNKKCPINNW